MTFAWGHKTYIMGILNITPDSFSGDGMMARGDIVKAAVAQALAFVEAGADIIDIGGESTRPGSMPVLPEKERNRIVPVVKAVRQAVDVPISIDTYHASVAQAALAFGANWINDVWGLRMDAAMPKLIADAGCPIIIMHNRSLPRTVGEAAQLGKYLAPYAYGDLLADVRRELHISIDIALAHGVQPSQIIIDPGIGFGKNMAQNLQLIDQLDQLKSLGFPILLGASRKGFIGRILDLPPDERAEGTAATVAIGIDRGADIMRVHDVKVVARVARMTDHIVRRSK